MMLRQAFPEWKSNGGIFYALEQNLGTPWRGAVDALSLDLDYYGNRSGSKIVSSLVKAMCEDGALSPDSITALAALLIAKYGLSWSRMWEAVTKEYDPLNNYDMKEVFDEDGTRAGSSTSSDAQNIFGFNSAEASPANSSSMQGSVSETTGTNHTLVRSGNIGVTTSAQMLQGEIDVRMRSFFEIVYTNIDEVLSIPVYGCAEDEETTGGGSTYKLPVAGPSVLGGVMPLMKTEAMTQPVGVDGVGRLYTQPAQGGGAVDSVNGKTGTVVLNYDDVGSPSLDEFQQIEDDVEQNTIMINQHDGAIQAVTAKVPFRFGIDADGNYGYIKDGADTVTPFKVGGGKVPVITTEGVRLPDIPLEAYENGARSFVIRKSTTAGVYDLAGVPDYWISSGNGIQNLYTVTITEWYRTPIDNPTEWTRFTTTAQSMLLDAARYLVWSSSDLRERLIHSSITKYLFEEV